MSAMNSDYVAVLFPLAHMPAPKRLCAQTAVRPSSGAQTSCSAAVFVLVYSNVLSIL